MWIFSIPKHGFWMSRTYRPLTVSWNTFSLICMIIVCFLVVSLCFHSSLEYIMVVGLLDEYESDFLREYEKNTPHFSALPTLSSSSVLTGVEITRSYSVPLAQSITVRSILWLLCSRGIVDHFDDSTVLMTHEHRLDCQSLHLRWVLVIVSDCSRD